MRYAPTIDKGHLFQYRLVAVLEKAHEMSNWEATMLQSSYKSTHIQTEYLLSVTKSDT